MLFRRLLNYLTDPIASDPNVGDVPIFDGSRFVAGPGGAPSWLLHTAGIPDNSVGSNGDYALGEDGTIYKKQAGTWAAYGGGGTTGRQNFNDTGTILVEGSSSTDLSWIPDAFPGDDLVDLTDPTQPFVKQEGVYSVQVEFIVGSTGAGNPPADLKLIGDLDYAGPSPQDEVHIPDTGDRLGSVIVVCHFAAGSHLRVALICDVGAGGGGASWRGVIERLS